MRYVISKSDARIAIFENQQEVVNYTNSKYFTSDRSHLKFAFGEDYENHQIKTWEELLEDNKKVWNYGMEILTMSIERLQKAKLPDIKSRKRQAKWNDCGEGEFDYEKFMAGNMYAFKEEKREESTGPGEVTIITDTTTAWNYEPEDILWRGAVSVALTKLLEEKGYTVELWVANGSHLYEGERYPVCTACRLKECGQPLDISTLINTVSGWFYRTAIFALLRTLAEKNGKRAKDGLGGCYTPIAVDLDELSKDPFRIYSAGSYSFSGAITQMERELERIAKRETDPRT